MIIYKVSTTAIADVFAGEVTMAKHGLSSGNAIDDTRYYAKLEVLRNCILNVANRFKQSDKEFNRAEFYVRCGLRPNGTYDS